MEECCSTWISTRTSRAGRTGRRAGLEDVHVLVGAGQGERKPQQGKSEFLVGSSPLLFPPPHVLAVVVENELAALKVAPVQRRRGNYCTRLAKAESAPRVTAHHRAIQRRHAQTVS